ncbi:MAG: M24 family metallopeptidase [Candidatus Saliniplasma sp.]
MNEGINSLDYEARVERLREKMEEESIDLSILYQRSNVRYFAGWRQNTTSFSILFITQDGLVHMVPKLDKKAVENECWIDPSNIYEIPENPMKKYIDITGEEHKAIDNIGIESETIFYSRFKNIKENIDCRFSDVQPIIDPLRIIKSPAEQELIREGADAISEVMTEVIETAEEGMKEKDLTAKAKMLMDLKGGETYSFEPFAMSGKNSWLPHRTSTDKKFKKGELILVDMGLIWQGYCTDITRTFTVGEPGQKEKDFFDAAYEAQKEAKKKVKPGIKAKEVHERAVEVFEEYGLSEYFPHLTGHGLGYDIHEAPIIDQGQETELKTGMVVTVEPGIYKEGIGGARVEDMLLVTEKGHEELTKTERKLI